MTAEQALQYAIKRYLIDAPEQGDWPWEEHCDGLAIGLVHHLDAHLMADYAIAKGALIETGIDRDGVPLDLATDHNLPAETTLYRRGKGCLCLRGSL